MKAYFLGVIFPAGNPKTVLRQQRELEIMGRVMKILPGSFRDPKKLPGDFKPLTFLGW